MTERDRLWELLGSSPPPPAPAFFADRVCRLLVEMGMAEDMETLSSEI